MGNASAFAGLLLLFGAVSASPAGAQTATVDGAYTRLSPGNAKIARALYEAQPSTTTTGSGSTARRTTGGKAKTLSLDEIAAMKQNGQGWGQIFQSMKAHGLVTDKNLGQVVSRYQHQQRSGGVVTTASNRPSGGTVDRSPKRSGDSDGSGSYDGAGHGHGGAVSAGNSSTGSHGQGYGRSGISGNADESK